MPTSAIRSSRRATSTGGAIPATASARSLRTRRSTSTAGRTPWMQRSRSRRRRTSASRRRPMDTEHRVPPPRRHSSARPCKSTVGRQASSSATSLPRTFRSTSATWPCSTSACRRHVSSDRSRSRQARSVRRGIRARSSSPRAATSPWSLLFAGGDGLTIATPIDPVLQRFGVTIEGAPPQEGPPSAPTAVTALAGAANVSLLLDGTGLRRRLAGFGLSALPRHEPRWRDVPPGARERDELPRHGPDQQHHLLLQGVRRERKRRRSTLQRSAGNADRPRVPVRAASRPRLVQPRERESALRRHPLVERCDRLHGDGPRASARTSSRARERPPAPPGETLRSTAPTPRRGRAWPHWRGRATLCACTCACSRQVREPTTATCCEPSSRLEPTRSCSSASTPERSSRA